MSSDPGGAEACRKCLRLSLEPPNQSNSLPGAFNAGTDAHPPRMQWGDVRPDRVSDAVVLVRQQGIQHCVVVVEEQGRFLQKSSAACCRGRERRFQGKKQMSHSTNTRSASHIVRFVIARRNTHLAALKKFARGSIGWRCVLAIGAWMGRKDIKTISPVS